MPKKKFTITGVDGHEPITKCCKMVVFGDDVSDGYHTIGELYDHRLALTVALFHAWDAHPNPVRVVKSKLHFDGTMFEGYFIVMAFIEQPIIPKTMQISYHYKLEHWDKFKIDEVERIPVPWDGHDGPETVKRLLRM